jgi:lipoyl(octanoyl) transferase
VPSVEIDTIRAPRPAITGRPDAIAAAWLGRVPYREAWALQKQLAAHRADGLIGDRLLLLEHPPVLTLGRHAEDGHVLADPDELERRGIEVIRVERGGEVTYHGPGQLVAYPILGLSDRALLVKPLVRALEASMEAACAVFGVAAGRREGHPGSWCDPEGAVPRKIGALGIRVERGVTYHGVALNVAPDLTDFDLIDPCGMPGLVSTSIAAELARAGADPSLAMDEAAVGRAAKVFAADFAGRIGAPLAWESPRTMAATA